MKNLNLLFVPFYFILSLLLVQNVAAQSNQYRESSDFVNQQANTANPNATLSPDVLEALRNLGEDDDIDFLDDEQDIATAPAPTPRAQVRPSAPTPPAARANTQVGARTDTFGRTSGGYVPNATQKKYVILNPETAFGPEVITNFDFPDISLTDLTKYMQNLTGINLIMSKDLKGRISITAPSPITVGDAWKAYLSALNANGYSAVKSGAFYKIVETKDMSTLSTSTYTGSYTPDTENFILKILPLKYVSSSEISNSFKSFLTRKGAGATQARMEVLAQTNTLLIFDTAENVNRLVRLIRIIDVPGHEETLHIIPVKNTSANELYTLLEKVITTTSSTATRTRPAQTAQSSTQRIRQIIPEARTNSLIVLANEAGLKHLQSVIAKLDVQMPTNTAGQVHVYYLNYGKSEDLATILSSIVSSSQNRNQQQNATRFTGAQDRFSLVSDVKVTADKSNNALVITASPTDYGTLKSVIEKLDIPKDQVLIEGLMMETSISRNRSLGISVVGAYGAGDGNTSANNAGKAGFLDSSVNLMGLIGNQFTNLTGLFAGAGIGPKVQITDSSGNQIQVNTVNAMIQAIATDANTNVLATPQLLVLDNEEGEFEVGETIPIPETTLSNGTSVTSIKTQKVTMKLKITPQIAKGERVITLKIDQAFEDFSGRELPSAVAQNAMGTTTRGTKTTVVARDQDTIAMSGMMRDKEISSENKVPLLGDIPVLGWLFKKRSKSVEKTNLLIFLTPKILAATDGSMGTVVKDQLNRRAAHLKDEIDDDDSFAPTVKGLYEKAKTQESGPLYNPSSVKNFNNSPQVESGGLIPRPTTSNLQENPVYMDAPELQTLDIDTQGLEELPPVEEGMN